MVEVGTIITKCGIVNSISIEKRTSLSLSCTMNGTMYPQKNGTSKIISLAYETTPFRSLQLHN